MIQPGNEIIIELNENVKELVAKIDYYSARIPLNESDKLEYISLEFKHSQNPIIGMFQIFLVKTFQFKKLNKIEFDCKERKVNKLLISKEVTASSIMLSLIMLVSTILYVDDSSTIYSAAFLFSALSVFVFGIMMVKPKINKLFFKNRLLSYIGLGIPITLFLPIPFALKLTLLFAFALISFKSYENYVKSF